VREHTAAGAVGVVLTKSVITQHKITLLFIYLSLLPYLPSTLAFIEAKKHPQHSIHSH
jgi:hypothetical protein